MQWRETIFSVNHICVSESQGVSQAGGNLEQQSDMPCTDRPPSLLSFQGLLPGQVNEPRSTER